MGGSSPSPPPVYIPPPPTVDNTQEKLDKAAKEAQQRSMRGRSSTILTSGTGLSDTGNTSKALLGS